jgi:hypothetical protein
MDLDTGRAHGLDFELLNSISRGYNMVKTVEFTISVTFTVTSKDARTELTGFTALRNTRRFSRHYQVTAKSVMRKVFHNSLRTLGNARILLRIDSDHTSPGVYRIRLNKLIAFMLEGSLHDDVRVEIGLDRSVQSQDGMNEEYNSENCNRIAKEGKVSQMMASFKLGTLRKELFLYFTDVLDKLSNQASTPMPDIWIDEIGKLVDITPPPYSCPSRHADSWLHPVQEDDFIAVVDRVQDRHLTKVGSTFLEKHDNSSHNKSACMVCTWGGLAI